jgi:hypothetical protein
MQYRHLRFFRSVKDKKVWLQGTTRMNSWGDPTDEWRGLGPLSTHTVCFPTTYGIPDLYQAGLANAIPNAQRRELNAEEHNKMVAGMHTIFAHFERFTTTNLDDCLAMLDKYTEDSAPFEWALPDMYNLYGRGPGVGASVEVAAQQSLGLPVGEVGQIYMCRAEEDQADTFILGVIRALAKDKGVNGVKMQWFTQSDSDGCKYKGTYKSVLPSTTRSLRNHKHWLCTQIPFKPARPVPHINYTCPRTIIGPTNTPSRRMDASNIF